MRRSIQSLSKENHMVLYGTVNLQRQLWYAYNNKQREHDYIDDRSDRRMKYS